MKTACESYKDSPQNITIESLQDESITTSKAITSVPIGGRISDVKQHKLVKISDFDNNYAYNVLPLYHDEYTVYDWYLSLRENNYLQLRWDEFLQNPPKDYTKIQLYSPKTIEKQQSRRKTLNGNPYDWNNKLAPIPNDHPDNFIRKRMYLCNKSFYAKEGKWVHCELLRNIYKKNPQKFMVYK